MSGPGPWQVTVVVAAYNEAQALPMLHPRIIAALDALEDVQGRVLYVDDGSRDATWTVLRTLAANDARVSVMRLSRNFGKEAALTAGLDRVDAGAAIILDADGQDPPELIGEFVRQWQAGYDNVHGTRIARDGQEPGGHPFGGQQVGDLRASHAASQGPRLYVGAQAVQHPRHIDAPAAGKPQRGAATQLVRGLQAFGGGAQVERWVEGEGDESGHGSKAYHRGGIVDRL